MLLQHFDIISSSKVLLLMPYCNSKKYVAPINLHFIKSFYLTPSEIISSQFVYPFRDIRFFNLEVNFADIFCLQTFSGG